MSVDEFLALALERADFGGKRKSRGWGACNRESCELRRMDPVARLARELPHIWQLNGTFRVQTRTSEAIACRAISEIDALKALDLLSQRYPGLEDHVTTAWLFLAVSMRWPRMTSRVANGLFRRGARWSERASANLVEFDCRFEEISVSGIDCVGRVPRGSGKRCEPCWLLVEDANWADINLPGMLEEWMSSAPEDCTVELATLVLACNELNWERWEFQSFFDVVFQLSLRMVCHLPRVSLQRFSERDLFQDAKLPTDLVTARLAYCHLMLRSEAQAENLVPEKLKPLLRPPAYHTEDSPCSDCRTADRIFDDEWMRLRDFSESTKKFQSALSAAKTLRRRILRGTFFVAVLLAVCRLRLWRPSSGKCFLRLQTGWYERLKQ